MERKEKKTYYNPKLEIVDIDRKIVLLQASDENNPPDVPFGTSSSSDSGGNETQKSDSESTKENNFDENPFQR